MSDIEQPAARFGSITFWCGALRMSAASAMKWTPQKTMYSDSGCSAAQLRELEAVAAVVGEGDDVLSLVVVAEDDRARAERRAGGVDAARSARRRESFQ